MKWPKIRLIWKIMLVFWLTLALAIWANIVITRQIVFQQFEQGPTRSELWSTAQQVVLAFESGEQNALMAWLSEQGNQGVNIRLLDAESRSILAQAKNSGVSQSFHQRWLKRRPPRHPVFLIQSANGKRYLVEIDARPKDSEGSPMNSGWHGLRFGITTLIILLGSLWLARSVSRPVGILRRASNLMAEGDLTARVSQRIGNRRDELGQLARSFDHMADRIHQLLSQQKQLFQDISHEIRTPLTRQKLALELIRSDNHNEQSTEYLQLIEHQTQIMDTLLDQLLTYMRLDSTDVPVERNPIDLTELIDACIDNSQLEFTNKKLRIEKQIEHQETILGDQDLISRAFTNILGNAIKYSPDASTITIQVRSENDTIGLSVLDQGKGAAEHNLDRLSQVFFREDDSRSKSTGGYGIGLAIVSRIMALHGGRLECCNRPGGGFCAGLIFQKTYPATSCK